MSGMDGGIELAELIRQLRGDLALAAWEGEGKELRFELGPIELEFQVAVESARQAGGKARVLVVDIGGDWQRTNSVTHRIKLTLQPRMGDGSPLVSGRAFPGEE